MTNDMHIMSGDGGDSQQDSDWSEEQEQSLQEHYELDDGYIPTWKFG